MSDKLEQDQPNSLPHLSEVASQPDPHLAHSDTSSGQPVGPSFRPNTVYPAAPVIITPAADASHDPDQTLEDAEPPATTPAEILPGLVATKSFWREVLETVLLTIIIFFLVKGLVANFRIQGSSMEPSFHTNQLVLVNKAAYFHFDLSSWARLIPGGQSQKSNVVWVFGGPKRGDVVVFEPPDVHDEDYIKRVIGLPGDKVEVKGGKVYVNDIALEEPYIKEAPFSPYNVTIVPPNNLFVLGDNRNASRDSRSFGMLPVDKIVGKAMMVYWPFGDKWGIVPELK